MTEPRTARIAITFSLKRKLKIIAENMSTSERTISVTELINQILNKWADKNEI